jgi:hypothetical protein
MNEGIIKNNENNKKGDGLEKGVGADALHILNFFKNGDPSVTASKYSLKGAYDAVSYILSNIDI